MSSSSTRDLPPRELALDDERRRFTTPRKDARPLRDSSLLVLLVVGRGDKRPLAVDGRDDGRDCDSDSCTDFRRNADMGRRIQDGDSRSFEGESVDMTSSDMEVGRRAGEKSIVLWCVTRASCRVNHRM
jgi:hypothetical protein